MANTYLTTTFQERLEVTALGWCTDAFLPHLPESGCPTFVRCISLTEVGLLTFEGAVQCQHLGQKRVGANAQVPTQD